MSLEEKTVVGLDSSLPNIVYQLASKVQVQGGRALIVGGAVRDAALGITPKDFDIEVHSMDVGTLVNILKKLGKVKDVGAAFGVLKLKVGDIDLDVSIPRTDSKQVDANRRGITAQVNPHLGVTEAARRRDFTMNAIAFDPLAKTVHDPFGGLLDIEVGRLRVVDQKTFAEDALRVLRAAQFVARFDLSVDDETFRILLDTSDGLHTISVERFLLEFEKLLKSPKPSTGLRLAEKTGALQAIIPEVANLKGVWQKGEYHPEGDALEHTFQSVDAAAIIAQREQLTASDTFTLTLAALLHDVGKRAAFERDGTAIGHEKLGAEEAVGVLSRLRVDNGTSDIIIKLIESHMSIHTMRDDITDAALRRLANKLFPANIKSLTNLSDADAAGRNNLVQANKRSTRSQFVLDRCAALGASEGKPADLISGKMLMAAGFKPGPHFKQLIDKGNSLRDEQNLTPEQALTVIVKEDLQNHTRLVGIKGKRPPSSNDKVYHLG